MTIEAIVENLDIKKKVFQELESYVSDDCIIASNTSSLSIASIASSLEKPERCVGIHFFNPAPLMKLVEVIPAIQTSDEVLKISEETIKSWGKVVAVAKDTPGFIVNRVARPFYGEALRIYEEGIADFVTIDHAMKTVGGFRMGPFELMDFIGNDVNYTVTETVFTAFYYDPRYKPAFTQKRFAEAGYLGRKSGRGYYQYENGQMIDGHSELVQNQRKRGLTKQYIRTMSSNAHKRSSRCSILEYRNRTRYRQCHDKGRKLSKGLLAWADEKGMDWCVNKMDELYNEYHEDRYRCSPLLRKMNEEKKRCF